MSDIEMLINECKIIAAKKIPDVDAINDQLDRWSDEAAAELEELHNCIDKLEGELAAEVSTKIQLRAKLRSMEDNEEWSSDKIVELAETIAQLRTELEMNKANLESFMRLQLQNNKLCAIITERYDEYLKKCSELDEARKVIEVFKEIYPEDYYVMDWWKLYAAPFLEVYPEVTK
jgi:chromosome segregation ATPase